MFTIFKGSKQSPGPETNHISLNWPTAPLHFNRIASACIVLLTSGMCLTPRKDGPFMASDLIFEFYLVLVI